MSSPTHRNPIRRVGDPARDQYTAVPNELIRDTRLSVTALAVALHLWSHRDGWEVSAVSLGRALGCDRRTVARALADLEEHGWIVVRTTGRTAREYYFHPARRLTDHEQQKYKTDGHSVPMVASNEQALEHSMHNPLDVPGTTPLDTQCTTKKPIPEDHREEQQERSLSRKEIDVEKRRYIRPQPFPETQWDPIPEFAGVRCTRIHDDHRNGRACHQACEILPPF